MNQPSPPTGAPAFPAGATWLNATCPPRLGEELKGHIVVLDFWTYCCVNCMHILCVLDAIERRFTAEPVVVVGVHSAKFAAERELTHLKAAIARRHIRHPVVVDNEHELWQRYAIKAWPTLALIDAKGRLCEILAGEIRENELAEKIEALLAAARAEGSLAKEPWRASTEQEDGRPPSPSKPSLLRHPGRVLVHEERIYIADTGHHRVLESDRSGRVLRSFGESGALHFKDPQGLARLGDQLVVADTGNHMLKSVDLTSGSITTLAGTGELWRGEPLGVSPQPTEMSLRSPWDLCASNGIVLVAMAGSHQIWLYDPEREIFGPFAGNGVEDHRDGPLREASFAQPSGLALLGNYLFVADSEVSSVRAVDLQNQRVETLTGLGLFDFGDRDGPAQEARLQHPLDVCVGFAKDRPLVYVADTLNNKIKSIELENLEVRTVLGDGSESELHEPQGMDSLGQEILICDTNNHRLRLGDPLGGSLRDFPLRD